MTQDILSLALQTILTIVSPLAWMYVGYSLGDWWRSRRTAKREYQIELKELTPEEAYAILNAYRESRARHPSQQFRKHPEMEEEDDC